MTHNPATVPKTGEDPMAPKVKPGEAAARHMLAALLEEAVLHRANDLSVAGTKACRNLVRAFLDERKDFVESMFISERDRAKETKAAYDEEAPYRAILPELLASAPEGMLKEYEPALYPADAEVVAKVLKLKAKREAET